MLGIRTWGCWLVSANGSNELRGPLQTLVYVCKNNPADNLYSNNMLNRVSLALTCFKIRLQADVWRFLQRILEMGVMLIHPEHGQYMTHCNGKSVPGVLDKYEEILEHLKISVPCSSLDSGSDSESGSGPVFNLKCIFKRSESFVSSFSEVWIFYKLKMIPIDWEAFSIATYCTASIKYLIGIPWHRFKARDFWDLFVLHLLVFVLDTNWKPQYGTYRDLNP